MKETMSNFRLTIAYDGTRYDGWQRQQEKSEKTIQGKIEAILSKMANREVHIIGASRTDSGVHAHGQIANVHLENTEIMAHAHTYLKKLSANSSTAKERVVLKEYLNQYLPDDIEILQVAKVSEQFHSRFNSGAKSYRYRIALDDSKHIFERKYLYHYGENLDVRKMTAAAAYIVGEHDFQSFCGKRMKKSSVRQIYDISFDKKAGILEITIKGSGFLYHMVRIMVGTLIEVGAKQRTPDSLEAILAARERAQAGFLAPAQGLHLLKIEY